MSVCLLKLSTKQPQPKHTTNYKTKTTQQHGLHIERRLQDRYAAEGQVQAAAGAVELAAAVAGAVKLLAAGAVVLALSLQLELLQALGWRPRLPCWLVHGVIEMYILYILYIHCTEEIDE